MRRRRAERCLLRAEIALEAGLDEEARAALDEARTLDSSTPTLEELRARMTAAAVPVQDTPRASNRLMLVAGSAVLVGLAAFGGWRITRTAAAPPADQTASSRSRDVILPAGEPVRDTSVIVKTDVTMADPVAAEHEVPRREAEAAPPASSTPPRTASPPASTPTDPPVVRAERMPTPAVTPVSDIAPPEERASIPAAPPVVPPPVASVEPPPAPRPAAPAPVVDETPRVRAVLTQYEQAYSNLDANAASAIWPTVDQAALARAFSALQAQRLSLGRCNVQVNGAVAQASCSGSASWTPKVGSGQTRPRHWDFTLQNAEGAWRIVTAQTR